MNAQQQMIAKYGLPDAAYYKKYTVLWPIVVDFPELAHCTVNGLPLKHITINIDLKAIFIIFLLKLRQKGLLGQLTTFDGCLEYRNTRGSSNLSLHSWAAAMDWDALRNAMKFHHEPDPFAHTTFTKEFIDIAIECGLFWGGYYSTRFDPMHFSLYNG